MRCKNCGQLINQHMAGSPPKLFWFSPVPGSLGDVWCDRGERVGHHVPDLRVPDLSVRTDVEEWLDA